MDEDREDIDACIRHREDLIQRLRQVIDLVGTAKGKMLGVMAREIVSVSNDLRDIGIRCVQKIIAWTFKNSAADSLSPPHYTWQGDEEYLCKMLHDLDFAAEKLPQSLKSHGSFEEGDPFFVSKHTPNTAQRRAAVGATLVVLDAVARQASFNNSKASFNRRTISEHNLSRDHDEKSPKGKSGFFDPLLNSRRKGVGDIIEQEQEVAEERKNASAGGAINSRAASPMLGPKQTPGKGHKKKRREINIFRGKYLYRRGDLLGEGAYAKVYECDRQDGRKFAVKIFELPTEFEDEATYEYRKRCLGREIRILKSMKHPNIIGYEESFVYKSQSHIVVEKMACPLMKVNIDRNPSAAIKVFDSAFMPQHGTSIQLAAYAVITQLLSALTYLHENHVLHRDIKPDNVLATVSARGFVVKLGDFGSARELPMAVESYPDLTNYVGSRCYRAPEVLGQNTSYGMQADIWSLGCTMAEFIVGRPLFYGETEQEVLDSILTYRYTMSVSLRREIESRGLTITPLFKKSDRLPVISFFAESTDSNLIKENFVSAICDKMLCLPEIERNFAKDLSKVFMAMSSDTSSIKKTEQSMIDDEMAVLQQRRDSISKRRKSSSGSHYAPVF